MCVWGGRQIHVLLSTELSCVAHCIAVLFGYGYVFEHIVQCRVHAYCQCSDMVIEDTHYTAAYASNTCMLFSTCNM